MTKRLIDVDDQLLRSAAETLGTSSMKETVNRSLEEVVRLRLRRRHASRLKEMQGIDLDRPEIMSQAWR